MGCSWIVHEINQLFWGSPISGNSQMNENAACLSGSKMWKLMGFNGIRRVWRYDIIPSAGEKLGAIYLTIAKLTHIIW